MRKNMIYTYVKDLFSCKYIYYFDTIYVKLFMYESNLEILDILYLPNVFIFVYNE